MSLKLTKETFIERYLREGIACNGRHKKYLLQFGLKENKCEECGLSEWNGKPLVCQVHHINGNRNDNRLENLQMLCPNCHSQTDNFQNKNTYKYEPRTKMCKNCGKQFVAKGDYQMYCSIKCRDEYLRKNQREYKSPYTKEFMQELCQKYNTLDEIGFVIHKTRDTVKRNLIQHGLFEDFIRKRDSKATSVLQYDVNGNFIKEWPSMIDAQDTLKVYHIGLVCRGKRKSAGGYIWKFKDMNESFEKIEPSHEIADGNSVSCKILQYDLEGNFIQEFNSIEEASETTDTNKTSIVLCMQGKHKQANNYIWKYKEGEISPSISVSDVDYINRTPVLMYNTQGNIVEEFRSIKEASEITNIGYANICHCLRGTTQAAGGYIWRYKNISKKPLDEEILNRPIPNKVFQSKVGVLQYDLNGHFIREFESVAEASRETNTRDSGIEKCVRGKQERVGNYIWKRKTQENIALQIPPYNPKPKRKKSILQYDEQGNFIQEYITMEDALKCNKISRGTLMKCLSGIKKSYNGYVWKTKDSISNIIS